MDKLKWWMRAVGVFYVALGVINLPFVFTRRLEGQYPSLGAPLDSVAVKALVDTWFLFGIEIGVMGVALIVASRNPGRYVVLVWMVLALELLRGIAHDMYLLTRGYASVGFYVGFAIVHLVIIATGFAFARQHQRSVGVPLPGP
ncbi:MAG: BphX family protein [Chloroflexi bacterium]|nr:BphX family protein [Chloroflexota bacterium]